MVTIWTLMEESAPTLSGFYLFIIRNSKTGEELYEPLYWDSSISDIVEKLEKDEQLIKWAPYREGMSVSSERRVRMRHDLSERIRNGQFDEYLKEESK